MSSTIRHESLRAVLTPSEQDSHCQFRGIKYAYIPGRFENSTLVDDWNWHSLDCRQFGPRCPQVARDVRRFFSIPAEQGLPNPVAEDEFECLNLVVSVPNDVLRHPEFTVPVLVYLHGGGHAYTMVNIEQGLTDPTDIIKMSVQMRKPLIIVHAAYRLNVFGYGVYDNKSNFGFYDQKRAVEWVRKHISGFGGDPNRIVLHGESAGAIAVHAHIHGPSPTPGIWRAILQSGSLYLTPPAPRAVGEAVMQHLAYLTGYDDLKSIPTEALLGGLGKLGFQNWWLHEDEALSPGTQDMDWPISGGPELEAILIGDCQWESRGFEPTIVAHGLEGLRDIFDKYSPVGSEIVKLYEIDFSSLDTALPRISAFINDVKFAFGTSEICRREHELAKRTCYRYVMDQANPWNKDAGAHHAIDLLFLFGGPFDYTHDTSAQIVSSDMRGRWVAFANGEDPWEQSTVYSFGPGEGFGPIHSEELTKRRRVSCITQLGYIGWRRCQPLMTRLMGARGVVDKAYLEE
ncbi:carboxylesterase [Plenodomus tracheiphilus IPT5]|uniref:Carboxylic ester hydrolase n=1 Tax=Plenodomus tracheiphilus IPT5 TaxID=1408161 RepID=A0A6A7B2L7_9PLEO|nr:carboxylesterase [Plenodomus tracheiphilus IPT5]